MRTHSIVQSIISRYNNAIDCSYRHIHPMSYQRCQVVKTCSRIYIFIVEMSVVFEFVLSRGPWTTSATPIPWNTNMRAPHFSCSIKNAIVKTAGGVSQIDPKTTNLGDRPTGYLNPKKSDSYGSFTIKIFSLWKFQINWLQVHKNSASFQKVTSK